MNDGRGIELAEQRIERAIDDLDPAQSELCCAARSLLRTRVVETDAYAFVERVSRAEAGTEEQVTSVAAAHHLWWLAAHVMDDVIDRGDLSYRGAIAPERAVMAAVVCATTLSYNILLGDNPAHAVTLAGLLGQAWSMSNDGQIRDVESHVLRSDERDITLTYRHKNGAAYGMAAAAAAVVAGCPPRRVELWRGFGIQFGALGQCRNDQEDLLDQRHEDLQNATATFHAATALRFYRENSLADYQFLHDFFARPDRSLTHAAQAGRLLLDERVVVRYLDVVVSQKALAVAALDRLHLSEEDRSELVDLVERSAAPLPDFAGLGV